MPDRLTDSELDRIERRLKRSTWMAQEDVTALIAEAREHRAVCTLTDEEDRWCEMVGDDARRLDAPVGSTEAALRDHMLSALAMLARFTPHSDRGTTAEDD